MALTRIELDGMKCEAPDCDHTEHEDGGVFFHARCHLDSGLMVCYHNGVIALACASCDSPVAEIAVATLPEVSHA